MVSALETARPVVLLRAGGRCENCSARNVRLQMSHRVARGMGGTRRSEGSAHSPANLCALCASCHQRVEAHPAWAYDTGLKVRRGRDPLAAPVRMWDGWWLLADSGQKITAPTTT